MRQSNYNNQEAPVSRPQCRRAPTAMPRAKQRLAQTAHENASRHQAKQRLRIQFAAASRRPHGTGGRALKTKNGRTAAAACAQPPAGAACCGRRAARLICYRCGAWICYRCGCPSTVGGAPWPAATSLGMLSLRQMGHSLDMLSLQQVGHSLPVQCGRSALACRQQLRGRGLGVCGGAGVGAAVG